MAASSWQPSLLQRLMSPNIARLDLAELTEEQQAVALLAQLVQSAGLKAAAGGAAVPVPVPALTLPLGPTTLNQMLLAAQDWGNITALVDREEISVAAGATVTLTKPVPYGYVNSMVKPTRYYATYYDPAITAEMTVDGYLTFVTALPLDGPGEIRSGLYVVARQNLTLTIANKSEFDSIVTYDAETLYVNARFYTAWYEVLLRYGIDAMTDAVNAQTGQSDATSNEQQGEGKTDD